MKMQRMGKKVAGGSQTKLACLRSHELLQAFAELYLAPGLSAIALATAE